MIMHVQENISLKPYTTFMTESQADYFIEVNQIEDLYRITETREWKDLPRFILGSGSNVLFVGDFKGLIVHLNTKGKEVVTETETEIDMRVAAGESWHEFVMDMVSKNYWGIENLALIPGTVGAAPVQNIGAYGVEIKDIIVSVEAINIKTRELHTFNNTECNFSYRNSFFKQHNGEYIVTAATFRLSKIPQPHLQYGALKELFPAQSTPNSQEIAEAVINVRQSKLPDVGEIGMAGSFFKNPIVSAPHAAQFKESYPEMVMYETTQGNVKISAGWLIEYLNYKGIRQGEVGTYHKHALVLVNYGNASGKEVWDFAQEIINKVKDTFDIDLEPEVLIVRS